MLEYLNNYEPTLNILKLKLTFTHDNKLNGLLHPNNNISKTTTKTRNTQRTSIITIDQNKTAANSFRRMLSQREEYYIEFFYDIKNFLIKKLRMCILKS